MKKNFTKKISNWGLFPVIEGEVGTGETEREVRDFVLSKKEVIARGNGRCYGDASLSENMFSTKRLNKFLQFDRIKGILECEAGILLSDILELTVPQGFFLYVTPGTKYISIGGAIASNVHGKNHHLEGSFCDHVYSFKLMTERGEIFNCSRDENSDLFWATVGGMGLTGIILSAKIELKKIESTYIKQEIIKADNLEEIFKLFEESEDWTYTVAWIDCLQKGKNMGRSMMMRGEHATKQELPPQLAKKKLEVKEGFKPTIPFFFPGFALNTLSVKIFNWLYYNKQRSKVLKNFTPYEPFFYPLDVINDWNKIYGKKGFIQYQMVIPKDKGYEGMKKILEVIAKSGEGSFLAVLKLFGESNEEAYNSFPMRGYTLALDFKNNRKLPKLVKALDDVVEEFGGRIYRTKDSMSRPSLTNYLKNVNSTKFVSLQQKRIKNA